MKLKTIFKRSLVIAAAICTFFSQESAEAKAFSFTVNNFADDNMGLGESEHYWYDNDGNSFASYEFTEGDDPVKEFEYITNIEKRTITEDGEDSRKITSFGKYRWISNVTQLNENELALTYYKKENGRKFYKMNTYIMGIYSMDGKCKKEIEVVPKINTRKYYVEVYDIYEKGKNIYIVWGKTLPNWKSKEVSKLYVSVHNKKTGKKISSNILCKDYVEKWFNSVERYNKIKFMNNNLYIATEDSILQYTLNGKKCVKSYKLPEIDKDNKTVVFNQDDELCICHKNSFDICGKYLYYSDINGVYRCNLKKGKKFKLYYSAGEDQYFKGNYDFRDMVVTNDKKFYIVMGSEKSELGNDTDIIQYSR